MSRVLVRPTSPLLADGLLTHIQRRPVDIDLARRQWDDYVSAWQSADWDVLEVPAAPEHADSVFVEDTVVIAGDRAVLCRPGAPQRRGEVAGVSAAVDGLSLQVAHIAAPATVDGGDVLKIGSRCYVGVGGRTTADGCTQLAAGLAMAVVPVPITKVLHLKSAVTALPDGTVIGYPPLVDDPSVFDSFLPVPEPSGSHVVVVDERTVLMAASAPRTADLLRARGLRTITVDISEYEKLEGCVTCLSVRLR